MPTTLNCMTAAPTNEIGNLLAHAADGGRITPDEALLLYTDAPLHALGRGGRRGAPPPLPRQHRDLHHRPQHQLHQRLRDGLQVLRVLPRARSTPRAGRTPTRRSCAAAARRSTSAPPRSCCRAATRPSSASSGTSGSSPRSSATTRSWCCTRSARPRSCTSARRPASTSRRSSGGCTRRASTRSPGRAPRSSSSARAPPSRR